MKLIPDNGRGLLSSGASSECALAPHRLCIWKRSLGLNIAAKIQVASYSGVAAHTCQSPGPDELNGLLSDAPLLVGGVFSNAFWRDILERVTTF